MPTCATQPAWVRSRLQTYCDYLFVVVFSSSCPCPFCLSGPGKSLLATRGGPGVALNSPHQLFHSPSQLKSLGTFGRADLNSSSLSPKQQAKLLLANQAAIVTKESEIRPPGPSYYNPDKAFHAAQDKKTFHLNTASRWM